MLIMEFPLSKGLQQGFLEEQMLISTAELNNQEKLKLQNKNIFGSLIIQISNLISNISDDTPIYSNSLILNTVFRIYFFFQSHFPYMIWMFFLIIIKYLWSWGSMSLWTSIFRDSPTSITNISHSIVCIYCIILDFFCNFPMMSMMLKTSNEFA